MKKINDKINENKGNKSLYVHKTKSDTTGVHVWGDFVKVKNASESEDTIDKGQYNKQKINQQHILGFRISYINIKLLKKHTCKKH